MIRKADLSDVQDIHKIINRYATQALMLSRSLSELYENVRDFFVYEKKGNVHGCCALHICWEDLAEVKCLAVIEDYKGKGIGRELVSAALNEAAHLGVKKLFALTYIPEFFERFGFKKIDKKKLPHKIWNECIKCAKFPSCDETALMLDIKGDGSIFSRKK